MIKITVEKLDATWPSFIKLLQYEFSPEFAFDLYRFGRPIKAAYEDFVKARRILIEKYGRQEGQMINIPPHSVPAFEKEIKPLLQKEIKIDVELLSLSSLIQNAPKAIAPSILMDMVDVFIKDDVEEMNPSDIDPNCVRPA